MKKLLLILLLAGILKAQDSSFVNIYKADTLKTGVKDTTIIKFANNYDMYGIVVKGSETDTVYVDTRDSTPDSVQYKLWTQKAVLDLSADTVGTFITATTTPNEWIILDPKTIQVRLRTTAHGSVLYYIRYKIKGMIR